MKIQLTFKTPDVISDAILAMNTPLSISQKGELKSVCAKFIEFDEYITIEIDTETKTAKVLEV